MRRATDQDSHRRGRRCPGCPECHAGAWQANGGPGRPISLAHAGYIDPADLIVCALNAVADFTPYPWHQVPHHRIRGAGSGHARGAEYPTRALLDSGALVNGGLIGQQRQRI